MVENGDDLAAPVPTAEDTRVGMPRWVKVSLIVLGVLVLVFVLANVIGGGEHGPGRHGGGDDSSEVVDEDGEHRPPVDHGP